MVVVRSAAVREANPGASPSNQSLEFRKAAVSRISDLGEKGNVVGKQGDPNRNEEQPLQNRQNESGCAQNDENPPENQPQGGLHVLIREDLLQEAT